MEEDPRPEFKSERYEIVDCKLLQFRPCRSRSPPLIIYRHTCAITIIAAGKPAPISDFKAILLSVFPGQPPLFDNVAAVNYFTCQG
jgi:hypothetical protein